MRYCETADELKACNVDSCKADADVSSARLALTAFGKRRISSSMQQHQEHVHMHSLDAAWR
jgi:hypothetical protein